MAYIGIDFGTSNSLASLLENNQINFLKFPDENISNPTILYFSPVVTGYEIGQKAIATYLEDIQESGKAGRLMQSIKTLLPDAGFQNTQVPGHGALDAAGIAAKFIRKLKELAEKQFSRPFENVVLGRPVQFNELALNRLEEAAHRAGFQHVVFWFEPVAAALAYELTLNTDELVCVVDIGGGTSDICVIALSPKRSSIQERQHDIKAIGGVAMAGDEFSARIMQHKIAVKFGLDSTYESMGKELPFPIHIIHKLWRWHWINLLNIRDINMISSLKNYSNRPEDIERLLRLIRGHHGFQLFQAIDKAKIQLSQNNEANVTFRELLLEEWISNAEFESMISETVGKITSSILDTLRAAEVKPAQIDRVLLTGGSAQIPFIRNRVEEIFGQKIFQQEAFSSVASGLGCVASLFK